jgi:hypothetical protein
MENMALEEEDVDKNIWIIFESSSSNIGNVI